TTPNLTTYHPNHHRIPLPTYPFQQHTHWLTKHIPQATVRYPEAPHALLDDVLLRSMDHSVFRTEFAPDRHWVLAEHRLLGEAIVPGTTYLEMARAAAYLHFGRQVTEIRDVVFQVPLLVTDDVSRQVHTTVRELDDGLAEFTVASHDPSGDSWTRHVRGVVGVRPFDAAPPQRDPAAMRERCALETVDTREYQATHRAMEFGHRWLDSLGIVRVGERAALGALELPERHQAECDDYVLHPALLDLATGFGGFAVARTEADRAQARTDRGFFLPVGYESLRIYGPIPARALSLIQARREGGVDSEVRTVDVVVCDTGGEVRLEITGFTTKRVGDAQRTIARLRPHTRHHSLRWIPAPTVPTRRSPLGSALIIGSAADAATELSAELRAQGLRVTVVEQAAEWRVTGPDSCRSPATAEGFDRVIDALGADLPDLVVHLAAPLPGTPDHLNALNTVLDNDVHCLFALTKALSQRNAMPRRLGVIAPRVARVSDRDETQTAVHATLFGLATVIGLENTGTEIRCVDIDEHTTHALLCAELLDPDGPATVALRENRRYVAELAPVDLRARPRNAAMRPDGVFLITGGLGGIGSAVAHHLSRTVSGARLALIGRTPRDTDATVRALEADGATVRVYYADVTDLKEMSDVVARIRSDLGSIGCIVHAAGVAGDGFLFRKDPEVFRRTLAPKVLGAIVLDLVTLDDPPDNMVNFGSTVSVFGAAGQGDYTAANSFLDHFADERTARGRRTVTVRWSDWLDVGMAADHGVEQNAGFFRSVSVAEGLHSFDEVLAAATTSVIVGEINYARLRGPGSAAIAELLRRPPVVLATTIEHAAVVADQKTRSSSPTDGPTLFGRRDGEYSEHERVLAGIWAVELGLSELNVHDNSFALGMDSLSALRVAQRVQKALDVQVSMADMFRFASVAELATHLGERTSDKSQIERGGFAWASAQQE
ncbi:SDR family NAD(P)-dependent oxidoreductase, partial [Nocardia sp. NPDC051911]|uniref:SDR family NAD(P)-dependent oxidoreductase n=1 Tax=Nocardia sp. NPDC051911 TaxID=3154648 RepID=UPI0034229E67